MDEFLFFELLIGGLWVALGLSLLIGICVGIRKLLYKKLTRDIQKSLGINGWWYVIDDLSISFKSSRAVDDYDEMKFFKTYRGTLTDIIKQLDRKKSYADKLIFFLNANSFKKRFTYKKVEKVIRYNLSRCYTYNVALSYVSPTGRSQNHASLEISREDIEDILSDPTALMTKSEYNQYVKSKNKELLEQKQHIYYDEVNKIIDFANRNRDKLIIKRDQEELDKKIASLFDRTVNSIKKVKDINSEEWSVIGGFIRQVSSDVRGIVDRTNRIMEYYSSSSFKKVKTTCDSLMASQREFNEYIDEKAQSISKLFGTRVVRNETVTDDEYNYVRPYKKSITPFTAEVSAAVFSSAENSPIEYIVKYFYPNKAMYPEQIQKLQFLIEELETLREAKEIIENYKKDYQQYITDVPSFVIENDEDGFYSRLGFANISESILTVEYEFSYTSGGGMARRTFSVPMTEETIIELINILQSKLSMSAFAKEQRALMTGRLRQQIKERDDYTCRYCGNSTHKEPNLLLEIDHIVPVAKGGTTEEKNLQTLCWKCNRSKGDKLV